MSPAKQWMTLVVAKGVNNMNPEDCWASAEPWSISAFTVRRVSI